MSRTQITRTLKRRAFLKRSAQLGAAAGLSTGLGAGLSGCSNEHLLSEADALALRDIIAHDEPQTFFKLSLAQWSLHRSFWGGMDNLDFAAKARQLGFGAVEYVNQFFMDKAEDAAYLSEMNLRANDNDIVNVLVMVDGEGSMGHKDDAHRIAAVENHKKWVRAARKLSCHAIRVNAFGKGEADDVAARVADSLHSLASYAADYGINIMVENHGGYSSNAAWLAGVMQQVNLPNCGTLPDLGNFTLSLFPLRKYDPYQGTAEMMPWAKGVSAKTHDFRADGEATNADYARMMDIIRQSGFSGYIGVEYEGSRLSEEAGILATRSLLVHHGAV